MSWSFTAPDLIEQLEAADDTTFDGIPLGVIQMDRNGIVVRYNALESRFSGLPAASVLGRHFFSAVAPCTNNFMVAHRFETEPELDCIIDYIFTLRMRPTPVRLRLLKHDSTPHMFLVVERT
jgi:photoactive yellow protein